MATTMRHQESEARDPDCISIKTNIDFQLSFDTVSIYEFCIHMLALEPMHFNNNKIENEMQLTNHIKNNDVIGEFSPFDGYMNWLSSK